VPFTVSEQAELLLPNINVLLIWAAIHIHIKIVSLVPIPTYTNSLFTELPHPLGHEMINTHIGFSQKRPLWLKPDLFVAYSIPKECGNREYTQNKKIRQKPGIH
jgi:hypothetical protein